MEQIARIGMDTSKHVFQLHGVNASEEPILRKKLRRKEMVGFFEKLPPSVVGIEACGGSHHWARQLRSFGHEVKLIPPQYVKPYVKRGKNDAADAEALCEAMSRPTMRFVPVKTLESQAVLMLIGLRDRLVRNRVQLTNAIRGYAAEFGLTAAKGMCKIEPLLERIAADESLPALARELFGFHAREYTTAAGTAERDRRQTVGVASRRRMQSTPGANPWRWPHRRVDARHENTGARGIPLGAALCGVARLDAEGSFDRRQGKTRRYHARGRRSLAQRSGGWRYSCHPSLGAGTTLRLTLAHRSAQAQAAETCRSGFGEQDRPYRLEDDDDRRQLQSRCDAVCFDLRSLTFSQPRGAREMPPR